MLRAVIALLTVLMLQGAAAAQAQRRAIVIGIAEYRELQGIVRPVGDARAVHDRLSQLGFNSGLVVNADGPTLQDAFNRFTASLQDGDVAVVYFSGHAGRVGGEFTLLAADAPPQGTRERRQQPFGLLLTTIADDIRVAGAQAQIFFIDACRGDPYVSSTPEFGASSCGELKEPLPEGSLALFSASAGQRALDRLGDSDQDPHSIFTRTLLGHLDDAGSVVRLARSVRTEVIELANSVQYQQTPAYLDELVGPPVVLVPSPSDLASAPPSAPPLPREPPPPPRHSHSHSLHLHRRRMASSAGQPHPDRRHSTAVGLGSWRKSQSAVILVLAPVTACSTPHFMRHRLAPGAVLWLCAVTRKLGSPVATLAPVLPPRVRPPSRTASGVLTTNASLSSRSCEPSRRQRPQSRRASIAVTRGPRSNKPSAATRHSPPKIAAWHGSMNAREARDSGRSSRLRVLGSPPVTPALGLPDRHYIACIHDAYDARIAELGG